SADLRLHLQVDRTGWRELRREVQLHAELLELNRHDGRDPAGGWCGCDRRVRKLTSCKETRFHALGDNQVWLGQNLENVLLLQRLNGSADIQIRPEEKKIEQIRNAKVGA